MSVDAQTGRESRGSRILDDLTAGGARGAVIALASTVVVFGLVAFAIINSAGWDDVRRAFFNGPIFRESFPEIARQFLVNIRIFLIAEALILVVALGIAVLRSLPGPVLFPFRTLAVLYTDLFRGIPTILVIYILGFGAPTLNLAHVPKSAMFWGITALVLVYSAYVAEVYRAGIDSVHPSQSAGARSLGLTQWQSMRFVVLPQAVRRVIPPLLNDFIGLQKDTALVSVLGLVEAARAAEQYASTTFNFTGYTMAALLFIAITIPLARVTDYLIERDRRRMAATGG